MGKRFHYTYRVKFPYQGWWYWGKHSTDDLNDGYCGTPVTHKEKWKLFYWEMEILEFFETELECTEVEKRLIRPDLNNSLCLNENSGGGLSLEANSRGGKTAGKIAVESGQLESIRTPESLSKGGQARAKVLSKAVTMTNIDTGEVTLFPSILSAARELGLNDANIGKVIQGKLNRTGRYTAEFTF